MSFSEIEVGLRSGDFSCCRGDSCDGPASRLMVFSRMVSEGCQIGEIWPVQGIRTSCKKRRIVDPITGFHDCKPHSWISGRIPNYTILYYTMQC